MSPSSPNQAYQVPKKHHPARGMDTPRASTPHMLAREMQQQAHTQQTTAQHDSASHPNHRQGTQTHTSPTPRGIRNPRLPFIITCSSATSTATLRKATRESSRAQPLMAREYAQLNSTHGKAQRRIGVILSGHEILSCPTHSITGPPPNLLLCGRCGCGGRTCCRSCERTASWWCRGRRRRRGRHWSGASWGNQRSTDSQADRLSGRR